ncbi:MAG TPA: wax ester/triacylglycerol synthase domain-containing protein [Acidimicrobiales bacterium]|nr:wax ester/triacylglycerol synthase domain-containing protein [Acidimicrobiales bacterium]
MAKIDLHFEKRMSDQDALMWSIEQDPLLRSTITGVTLLDQPPDRARLTDQVDRASRTVLRLRQRVVEAPYNIAPPEYVVDEHFDLAYHLRFQRAPGTGSLRDVLDFAGPFAMAGFDRARPLWEFVVLDGVEGGRAAMVQKIHHSLADGVGMMKLSMAFLETERDPRADAGPMPGLPPGDRPSVFGQVRSGVAYRAGQRVSAIASLPPRVSALASRPLDVAKGVLRSTASAARMLRPVSDPMSPIMGARSLSVRFDTLAASLPAMKSASKLVEGRLNDAFLAGVAGGLARYHDKHGVDVEQLRMTMPINVRPKGGTQVGGNQFVPARFAFPVSIVDPVERMAAMKALVAQQRAEPALGLAGPISGIFNRLPIPLTTAVFGSMLKAIDVVTSNVPGAPFPIYISGGRMLANYGFGPLSGAACNITLLSYVDDLHFGISTDPAAVPDPETFIDCLQSGIAEIEELAGP